MEDSRIIGGECLVYRCAFDASGALPGCTETGETVPCMGQAAPGPQERQMHGGGPPGTLPRFPTARRRGILIVTTHRWESGT